MPNFYLDIETTGVDPKRDKIITIQYVELERNTGAQKGELQVLKEWESSEKDILSRFISESPILDRYAFSFIPVGYNLLFEHKFLLQKSLIHGLMPVNILQRPLIDLRVIGILMNRGEFLGSGLDRITGKPHSGEIISEWYSERRWNEIENYIKTEADEFLKFCQWLYAELPQMRNRFESQNGIMKR